MKTFQKFDEYSESLSEAKSKYPELEKIVKSITKNLVADINKQTATVKSEMPYKAQWVLEELIKTLQDLV